MYLNVNLTPPQSGGAEGSCSSTPKTPEILNSLMSLTAAPSPSYTNYQASAGELLSPASSSASPSEENSIIQFGLQTHHTFGSQMSPTCSDPGGGGRGTCVLARVSGSFRGVPAPVIGTPSPPVPELPSPVNTVEFTKSALIKEGLKHQIKSKLQAAGMDTCELLDDIKVVKEELSDSGELTPQDEERRYRRRERNKVAATKCRNKKKEKTITLLSESETVEDQNLRLKSEIQRLASEKRKLEKLLEDPNHVASCRHSCKSSKPCNVMPLVVITSPDAPERLLPTSSAEETEFALLGCSPEVHTKSKVSDLSPTVEVASTSFCSSTSCESLTPSYVCESSGPSYVNLSPLSSCSLTSVSPPHLSLSPNKQSALQTHSHNYAPSSYAGCSQTLTFASLPPSDSPSDVSSSYLPSKHPTLHDPKRQQTPYSLGTSPRASSYSSEEQCLLQDCRDYYYPTSEGKEEVPLTPNACMYASQSNTMVTHGDYVTYSNALSNKCHEFDVGGKVRTSASSHCRFTPYDRSNRQHLNNTCATASQSIPVDSQCTENTEYLQSCLNSSSQFIPETQSQFYPSCTFGGNVS